MDTRFCLMNTKPIKLTPLWGWARYVRTCYMEIQGKIDRPCLFVIIMSLALGYNDIFVADSIDKPVFFVDPSAPFPFWAVL